MLRRWSVALLLFFAVAPAMAQYTVITAAKIEDPSGPEGLLASGKICATLKNQLGQIGNVKLPGGGQAINFPVCRDVINGVMQNTYEGFTPGPMQLADMALTNPTWQCYKFTVVNNADNSVILGSYGAFKSAYDCVQPTGTTWSFDNYIPPGVPGVPQYTGTGGSSIALKTNGAANGSQSTLNLKSGANVSLADDGTGGVTISASGTGSGLGDPGANGLIKRTATNVTAPAVAGTDYDAPGAAATVQTNLTAETSRAQAAETLLAPKSSPTFTGTMNGVSASFTSSVVAGTTNLVTIGGATGSCTGKVATADGTGCVSLPTVPSASSTTPNMDGTAAAGSSTTYARGDHVHPTDATRAADSAVVHLSGNETIAGNKTFTGSLVVGATNPVTIGGATGSCTGQYAKADGTGCGPGGGVGVLTLVPPSGDTTGATDTAAINVACAASKGVQLSAGAYYVNGALSSCGSNQVTFQGAGANLTTITNKSTTAFVFPISYCVSNVSADLYNHNSYSLYRDFAVVQSGTPTAGGGFQIGCSTANNYTTGLHVENVNLQGLWNGMDFENNEITNWFSHIQINYSVNDSVYYNAPSPSGDNWFDDISVIAAANNSSNVVFNAGDTMSWSGTKFNNGAGILFTGSAVKYNIRFFNPSIEGLPSPRSTCAVDFGTGTGPTNFEIVGGETAWFTTFLCHPANATNFAYLINNYNDGGTTTGMVASGWAGMSGGSSGTSGWMPMPLPTCTAGQFSADASYYYVCYTANTWGKMALSPFNPNAQLLDTFSGSGTAITAHNSDYPGGTTWTVMPAAITSTPQGTLTLSGSNAVNNTDSTAGHYAGAESTFTPSSANYTVSLNATMNTSTSSGILVVMGRLNGSNQGYGCWYIQGTGVLLYRINNGTNTQIGTTATQAWSSGATHTLSLVMSGSSISCSFDGSPMSNASATDSTYTAAGTAGFELQSNSLVTAKSIAVQ